MAVFALGFIEYAEKITVDGRVAPSAKPIVVTAPGPGRVVDVAVLPSDALEQGEILMRIERRVAGTNGSSDSEQRAIGLARQIQMLMAESVAAERAHLDQLALFQRQGEQLERELELADDSVQVNLGLFEIALQSKNRLDQLGSNGAVSPQESEAAHASWLRSQRDLHQARSAQVRLQESQAQLVLESRHQNSRYLSQVAAFAHRQASLETEYEVLRNRSHWSIRAPVAGQVDHLHVHANQMVGAGDRLLTIAQADHQHQVELFVPNGKVPQLKKGQTVQMRYAGYPVHDYGTVQGRLKHTSLAPVVAVASGGTSHYQVIVAVERLPEGMEQPKADLLVQADIVLRRQSLWRWLIEPMADVMDRL